MFICSRFLNYLQANSCLNYILWIYRVFFFVANHSIAKQSIVWHMLPSSSIFFFTVAHCGSCVCACMRLVCGCYSVSHSLFWRAHNLLLPPLSAYSSVSIQHLISYFPDTNPIALDFTSKFHWHRVNYLFAESIKKKSSNPFHFISR